MQNVSRLKYYYEYGFKLKKSYLTMCKINKREITLNLKRLLKVTKTT